MKEITTNINNFLKNNEELKIDKINEYIKNLKEYDIYNPVILMLPDIKEYIDFDTSEIENRINALKVKDLIEITKRNSDHIDYTSEFQKELIDNFIEYIDKNGLYKNLIYDRSYLTEEILNTIVQEEITAMTYTRCLLKKELINIDKNIKVKTPSFIDTDEVYKRKYSNEELCDNIRAAAANDTLGEYNESEKEMRIYTPMFTLYANNEKLMKRKELELKQSIYHELRHLIQTKIIKNKHNEFAYLLFKNLMILEYMNELYVAFHDYFEMELDADYYAAIKTNDKKEIDEINIKRASKYYDYVNTILLDQCGLAIYNEENYYVEYNSEGNKRNLKEMLNIDTCITNHVAYNFLINEDELEFTDFTSEELEKLGEILNYGIDYEQRRYSLLPEHGEIENKKYILDRIKKIVELRRINNFNKILRR